MKKYETSVTQESSQNKPKSKIIVWIVEEYRQLCNDVYFLRGKGLLGFFLFVGETIVILPLIGLGIMAIILPLSFVLSLLFLLIGLKTLADYVVLAGYIVMLLGTYLFAILYFAVENVLRYREYQERYIHIDSLWGYGRAAGVVINGTTYVTSDCIILRGRVYARHWAVRGKKEHSLSMEDLKIEDLENVLSAKPSVLLVGCGKSGFIKVPEETRQVFQKEHIQLEVVNTSEAIELFNELTQTGKDIAAVLHLES